MKARRQPSASPKKLRTRLRTQAESRVAGLATTRREVAQMPAYDVQRLVHELQVHQVELEMQNDELRRTQLELEQARDRYAGLYDFAPVAHLTLNARSEILEANLSAGKLLGLERGRLIHQKFARFVPADAQNTFCLLCQRVFSSDTRQSAELDLVNAQARRFVVHIEAVRDVTNPRKQCRVSFTDITERRQAEKALQAREAQLYSFVQQAPAAIAMFDRSMNYLAASRRWTGDFHPAPRDLIGRNHYEISPDLPDRWKAAHRKGLAGEAQFCDEDRWLHADGTQVWLRWSVSPWLDAHGDIGGIMILTEDISARKNAEAALRQSEERFRGLFETMDESFFLVELVNEPTGKPADWRYLDMNPAYLKTVGQKREAVVGRTVRELFPDLEDFWLKTTARVVLTGEPEYVEGFAQNLGRHFDCHFYSPHQGQCACLFTDITERKRAEQRIAQLNRVQAILGGIDHAIVHHSDRQQLLDEICRVAVEKGGFKLAWVGMVAPDGSVQPVAQAGATGYLEGIRVMAHGEPEGRGPVATAVRENRTVVIENIAGNADLGPRRSRALQFGLHYVAAFPIRMAGKVAGAFSVCAPQADFFDENELGLLTQVSDDISFALTAMAGLAAREQAEAALRRSEHNLSNFFNQAPIGLVWLSASGTILRANQSQLELLGYPAKDYLGHAFNEFSVDPGQGLELLKRLAAKETVRNFPMKRRCQDGTIRHVLVDASSLWSDNQFQYSSIFLRDVTERLELEKEILHAGEREQRRIAQDLHDGLGQILAGTAYLTSALQKKLAAKSLPEAQESGRILEVINEAIAQTRSLARGLHPVEPEPNGLMAALESLAARTKKMFQVRCRFTCPKPVLILDNALATHLFRIAQEAVTNAIKHGKPGRIGIGLAGTPGGIRLAIKDNGAGLPARPQKKPGMGLRIMRYRAGMIGGSVAIQKAAGGGTAIVCTVDLSGARKINRPPPAARKKKIKKD